MGTERVDGACLVQQHGVVPCLLVNSGIFEEELLIAVPQGG